MNCGFGKVSVGEGTKEKEGKTNGVEDRPVVRGERFVELDGRYFSLYVEQESASKAMRKGGGTERRKTHLLQRRDEGGDIVRENLLAACE